MLPSCSMTIGFINPLIIHKDGTVITGHGRLEATLEIGLRPLNTLGSQSSNNRRNIYLDTYHNNT